MQQAASLDWSTDGVDWPHREASEFVQAAGLRWHVQRLGAGPPLLLLHGTGAATHSWRGMLPLLATRFSVVAPDLPGHGFTGVATRDHFTLPGMAGAITQLLDSLRVMPEVVVGHSAGAALLMRMTLDGALNPRLVVSLNGALLPFAGLSASLFPPLAKVLAGTPLVARFVAHRVAGRAWVQRLLRETGSVIDAQGEDYYVRLARTPAQIEAALAMMAGWDLDGLARDLHRLRVPVLLVAGENDRTIPPVQAERVQAVIPRARRVVLPGLGHLAHEESPDLVAGLILNDNVNQD